MPRAPCEWPQDVPHRRNPSAIFTVVRQDICVLDGSTEARQKLLDHTSEHILIVASKKQVRDAVFQTPDGIS